MVKRNVRSSSGVSFIAIVKTAVIHNIDPPVRPFRICAIKTKAASLMRD